MNDGPRLRPRMTVADVSALLGQVATRDREAFQRLYEATSAKLFGVILRILRERELSEDILQEAYVRIWDNAAKFDPDRASPIT